MAFALPLFIRSLAGPASADSTPRSNPFTCFIAALAATRQRQADEEIARWLARHGGKFTDDLDRQIERRVLAPHTDLNRSARRQFI